MSFHHVRLMHGSALNRSDRDRRLLLFQYTAVDAWPLVRPVQDIEAYNQLIVAGEPTLMPRLTQVPVRMPLPPAPYEGSIYENQRTRTRRYFDTYREAAHVG
jgi:phytanoyl-CoA hydroxylase